jgi:hypothetical protein
MVLGVVIVSEEGEDDMIGAAAAADEAARARDLDLSKRKTGIPLRASV